MTLAQLLATTASDSDLYITVLDSSSSKLITFLAAGYEQLSDDLTEQTVSIVTVSAANKLIVTLAES